MTGVKRRGNKPWKPTKENLLKIEAAAARGLTVVQIAHIVGVCKTTFYNFKAEHPEIQEAIERGRAHGVHAVTNALFEKATKHQDLGAMCFYLKNRDPENWEDVQKRHIAGHDGKEIKANLKVEFVGLDDDPDQS